MPFPILLLFLLCMAATTDTVKNVLIIGDSISIGYTPFIQKALAPEINVVHNPGNGGSTIRDKGYELLAAPIIKTIQAILKK